MQNQNTQKLSSDHVCGAQASGGTHSNGLVSAVDVQNLQVAGKTFVTLAA